MDWVLMRWHLDWQLGLVVPGWSSEEELELLLSLEAESLLLVLDDEERVTLDDSFVIGEGDWAVSKDSLLLRDDLSGLVMLESDWETLGRAEDNVIDESSWVLNKHVSLGFTSEVEEGVLVQDSVLLVVSALDELLLVLPGDWAVVAKLREGLLHDRSIVVSVLHQAWLGEEHVCGKVLSGIDVCLNRVKSFLFHVPLALETIDFNQVVVVSVVETKNVLDVALHVSESVSDDGSVALEDSLKSVSLSSLVDLLLRNSNEEHIGWLEAV